MNAMIKWFLLGVILLAIPLLTGCDSEEYYLSDSTTVITSNGTSYDPSRSFELLSFCSSTSFSTAVSPDDLNCSIGNITDLFYSNITGNWSCMSCSFDTSKCTNSIVSNITLYSGLNLSAEHIISSDYDGKFTVMCCNDAGSMCYRPEISFNTSAYYACGAGYNELIGSISFNNVTNNWSVTSCLNGFK